MPSVLAAPCDAMRTDSRTGSIDPIIRSATGGHQAAATPAALAYSAAAPVLSAGSYYDNRAAATTLLPAVLITSRRQQHVVRRTTGLSAGLLVHKSECADGSGHSHFRPVSAARHSSTP